MIDIIKEPKGKAYSALIDYAIEECSEFSLVVRQDSFSQERKKEVLDALEPYLTESKEGTTAWPGTKLVDSKATLYYYICQKNTGVILKKMSEGLFSWRQPEDLCFYRTNRIPWLVSIAHEGEAYIDADNSEMLHLKKHLKGLELRPHQYKQAARLKKLHRGNRKHA